MKLIEVPSLFAADFWPLARDLVDAACERSGGRYKVDDVLQFIMTDKMQLWIMMEDSVVYGVALAEIITFPHLRECRVLAATGHDVHKWAHFIGRAEEWAKERGCTKLVAITRPGWEKIMKPFGYEKNHVQMEKDLGYVH